MAQNHDELAAALDALSRGDVPVPASATPPTPPLTTSPPIPPKISNPAPPPRSTPVPPPAAPTRPVRAAAPTSRPAAPGQSSGFTSETDGDTPQAARPAAPRAARPSAPNLSPPPVAQAVSPPAPPESLDDIVFDDEDASTVPEMAHTGPARKLKAVHKPSVMKTMKAKQTLIPILLTLGVIALIAAATPYVVAAGSPLAGLKDQPIMIGGIALVGVLLLAVAGMNMAQVASALKLDAQ